MPGGTKSSSPSVESSTVEQPNQQQLKDVHKQYRIIEGSRRIYHGESEGIMRRQEATLANIRTDSRSLREMVDTYFIPDYKQQMSDLQEEAEKFNELVEHECQKLNGLQGAVGELYSGLLDFKKNTGGVFAAREKHRTAIIHIKIMENRLHKAVVDLNTVEKQNKNMKKKMQELKEEREYYNDIRCKLEKELQWKEKEMEKCIDMSNLMYEERNEFEERFTDLLAIHGDMEGYKMWKDTNGWAIMEPEPIANFMHVNRLSTEEERLPKECSLHFRQWIETKALANIQDILDVDEVTEVLPALQNAQQKFSSIIELVNELIKQMDDIDGAPRNIELRIESAKPDPKSRLINRKLDMEKTLEAILDLLKELDLDDEDFLPIIREMKRQVSIVFQEAGCSVPVDEEASVEKGPLEASLTQWFGTIEDFIDELMKSKPR